MCVCSVLAPHGCPEPPAPATRLSHHQSQAHDHSRRDARAAVNLTDSPRPLPGACTLFQAPCSTGARRARHDAAPAREARAAARRARRPPRTRPATRTDLLHSLLAAVQQTCWTLNTHARSCRPPTARLTAPRDSPVPPGEARVARRARSRAARPGSPHPSCLCAVHSVHNNTLTHARAAHALRDRPRPEKTAALQHK